MNGAGQSSPRLARAILVLLLSAPGPRQARTKELLNEAAPGPGQNSFHGQRSHDTWAYRARAEANEPYRSKPCTSALYMACPVTMTVIPLLAGFVNGLVKVARLCWLFVNAIFYCLARTILARTRCGPKMMSYWKGYESTSLLPLPTINFRFW